jgi:ubiquinone/menaquinone biosynthesis C-methylase UbiE
MHRPIDYTRRSYERRADSYDSDRLGTDAQNLWQAHDVETLDELVPHSGRILEVACGTGRMTIPLAMRERTLVGMELSGAMLRKAVNKSRDIESCTWLQGNAAKLPFRSDAFDALYAVRFMNLFRARDLRPLCDELVRVVRPGGVLVLHISNALYGAGISLVRQRLGSYNKHSLWPWQLRELFPACQVQRSIGSYLPGETRLLMRVGDPHARRIRRFVSTSVLRYVTHTRFVQLVKTR